MWLPYLFIALSVLMLLGIAVLLIVTPFGWRTRTDKLIWSNLCPWTQTEWYQRRRQLRQWRRLGPRWQSAVRVLDPKAVPPSKR